MRHNKKRITVIYGRKPDVNAKELLIAARDQGHEASLASILALSAYVDGQESRFWIGNREITGVNFCFVRSLAPGTSDQMTMRISLLKHMELSGISVVNPPGNFSSARNKYLTYCILAENSLPVPSTYITGRAAWARSQAGNFKDFIYKPMIGSKGYGSMKFNDADLAYNAFHLFERLGQPILVQEYLQGSGSDIRAFVIAGEVVAAMRRVSEEGQWKANLAQGAKGERIELDRELSEIAVKAASCLGLKYAGVDLMEADKGPVVLEVNASPSWQGIQEITGTDIPRLLIEKIVDAS